MEAKVHCAHSNQEAHVHTKLWFILDIQNTWHVEYILNLIEAWDRTVWYILSRSFALDHKIWLANVLGFILKKQATQSRYFNDSITLKALTKKQQGANKPRLQFFKLCFHIFKLKSNNDLHAGNFLGIKDWMGLMAQGILFPSGH